MREMAAAQFIELHAHDTNLPIAVNVKSIAAFTQYSPVIAGCWITLHGDPEG